MTDLYQLTMAASYLTRGMVQPATFSPFVRRLPRNRSFLVAAGIEEALSLLESFGLALERDLPISSFSKGMVQKVLLTSALLHDPEVVLMDEPLSGLDVTTGLVIKDLVRMLAEADKIIIYSSHVLEVVEKVCSRAVIIHRGAVVADDSVENLRNLMQLPNLEDIFSQLVVREDTEARAREILGAIRVGAG